MSISTGKKTKKISKEKETKEKVIEESWILLKNRLKEKGIKQKDLGEYLNLSKYDVSKLLHGNRRVNIYTFLDIAYKIGLLDPKELPLHVNQEIDDYRKQIKDNETVNKTQKKQIENLEKEINDLKNKIENLEEDKNKLIEKTTRLEKENEEITQKKCELEEKSKNPSESEDIIYNDEDFYKAAEKIWDYIDDTNEYGNTEDNKRAFYDLLERIKKAITEMDEYIENDEEKGFTPISFLEYQTLRKNKYLIENQYVFNLKDLL